MDELSITEILNGLKSLEFKESHSVLIECLINRAADLKTPITETECKDIFTTAISVLNTEQTSNIVNLLLILCSNLSCNETHLNYMVQVLDKSEKINKQFNNIATMFLVYNPQIESISYTDHPDIITDSDPWQHFASVLCNFTQMEYGRNLLLKKSSGNMEKLLKQIYSKNAVRRRGVVGCIRSCLFDKTIHWWMVEELNVLRFLLIPLIPPTPFTDQEKEGLDVLLWLQAENAAKVIEPEKDIMKMLLESLTLICQTRNMREVLRKRKIYLVVRNLDLVMEDEAIKEAIIELVDFLIRDEGEIETAENKLIST